ncbi:MAG: hypothetical protein C5B50_10515 [Verrucomicrobia bacterium]|nr:MAG: hypothetical protein C5B50_10515 [Verrucomicrobiota bacterium]
MNAGETREYTGRALHLHYPAFLRVESKEPEWYAAEPDGMCSAIVRVDPPLESDEAFGWEIRNPYYAKAPGVTIQREGVLRTPNGIEGFERLAKLTIGGVSWGWCVQGRICAKSILNITITSDDPHWGTGAVWMALIESIDMVSDEGKAPVLTPPDAHPSQAVLAKTLEVHKDGVVKNLPRELDYLVTLAFELASLPDDDLDDNPEVWQIFESRLKTETQGMTDLEARKRMLQDRKTLMQWLQDYPQERFPETQHLWSLVGVLLYAPSVFKPWNR